MKRPSFDQVTFLRKLQDQSFHFGIVGLGSVGLPLALTFAERTNCLVIGIDTDGDRIDRLTAGQCYLDQLPQSRVVKSVETGRFRPSRDFSLLGQADAVLVAVPTPLDAAREPDLTCIVEAMEAIASHLRPGQLIVLESTTYPGTTEDVVRPILESSGLKCEVDFLLAFSPEREDPGNPDFQTASIPKLVGGIGTTATELATALYRTAFDDVVPVASPQIAEASKLTENVFRAVNIALVNELKMTFQAMNIDIWDVLDAASTKPFGYMRFNPGPGLGGHCIALDPYYLAWKARVHGVEPRLLGLAGEINGAMPRYVVDCLVEALRQRGKPILGSRVLLLGIAYKPNVNDVRESPAFEIISRLRALDSTVSYHDPHVPTATPLQAQAARTELTSVPLSAALLGESDAVIIVTDHAAIDFDFVLEHAQLIVDPRGVFRGKHPKVVHA